MKTFARVLAIALVGLMLLALIPMSALAAENTYVLDASSLPAVAKEEKADGDSIEGGTDNYFTIYLSAKAQIHSNEKTFSDGFSCTQRLHYGASTKFEDGVQNAIQFKTSGPATVTIWWGCGDVGRQIGLYNGAGELLSQTNDELAKNDLCISTLEIAEAGTYFIGNVGGNNYHYKVEVAEGAAEPAPSEPAPSEPVAPPTEPVEPPVEPNVPTGDPIGIVVALMAISGTALVVLKKKEN